MKAVNVTPTAWTVVDVPIPKPEPYDVLIRNVAVAANPKDWKHAAWIGGNFEAIEGNDVAGYVHEVGDKVTNFQKGDRVAGLSINSKGDKSKDKYGTGGYAEYTLVPEANTFQVSDSISFEDISTLPLAVMTALLGLFIHLGIPETPSDNSPVVVVNGASSSVGSFATQLAHLAGCKVVAVAGSAGNYAKECGADIVVDYRGKDSKALATAVREAADSLGGSHLVYDAVGDVETTTTMADAIGRGIVTTVIPGNENKLQRKGIETPLTLVWTSHAEHQEFAKRWYQQLERWMVEGKFKPNKVKVIPGGLDGVPVGLGLLKDGKVSGEKLVYRILETSGL